MTLTQCPVCGNSFDSLIFHQHSCYQTLLAHIRLSSTEALEVKMESKKSRSLKINLRLTDEEFEHLNTMLAPIINQYEKIVLNERKLEVTSIEVPSEDLDTSTVKTAADVVVGTTSTEILKADPNRSYSTVFIENLSRGTVYVGLGQHATGSPDDIHLHTGGIYQVPVEFIGKVTVLGRYWGQTIHIIEEKS